MIFHINKTIASKIRVQTPNVDTVLVYLLYHMQFWPQNKGVWIQTDMQKQTIREIDVRKAFQTITPMMINALPSWFIFTGCDYEPSFYKKGRKTCWKTFEKSVAAQCVFSRMGAGDTLKEFDISVLGEFVCSLYGEAKRSDVNQARVSIFKKAYDDHNDFTKKGNKRR